ncbi:MAG: hypothetical protein RQ745_00420 [Longimicrobiales bacterium]|nr:hypothetical protein [Longimicrobiales bacterium]
MIRLLDVNVLMALAWPNHIHHRVAHRWFERIAGEGWATTPVTESGFVRVSSNARVLPEAARPVDALELLRRMRGVPGHTFWPDDVELSADETGLTGRIVGHRQVTDAHLVLLAHTRGGRVATFERGMEELAAGVLPTAVERIETDAA